MPEKKKMGRPILGKPKNVQLHLLIDEDTLIKMNILCEERKISKAELVRQLVKKEK